jgi:hypothetical protein
MNAARSVESGAKDCEAQWKEALVQAEGARQIYTESLRATDRDDAEIGRLWLRLWLAERCAVRAAADWREMKEF